MNVGALLTPLRAVLGVVATRHTMPILSHALIERQAGAVQVTVSDIGLQVSTQAAVAGLQADSAFTVPARKLCDILAKLPEGKIALQFTDKRMSILADGKRFALATMAAPDFPKKRVQESSVEIELSQAALKAALARIVPAIGKRDIRHYLNDALFDLREDALALVGCDEHRLARVRLAVTAPSAMRVIVPSKAIIELLGLLPDDAEGRVKVHLHQRQVRITWAAVELTSDVIDGSYPNYERVIPTEFKAACTIQSATFRAALSRAELFTAKYGGTVFSVDDRCLRLETQDSDEAIAVSERTGVAVNTGYNVAQLLDIVSSADAPSLRLQIAPHDTLMVSIPGRDDYLHIVSPMKV
jgi:DNA polymerase-3 subunit beta